MNDLVSRQAVKEWLSKWIGYIDEDIITRMQYRVIDITSAQPERLSLPDDKGHKEGWNDCINEILEGEE